jgi:hypothetical protein
MNTDFTKISLIYTLGGEYLVSRGKYKPAKISRTKKKIKYDCGVVDFETVIDKPIQTIKHPEYKKATTGIVLGEAFVESALERPKPPKRGYQRWLRTETGRLYQDWNTLSEIKRLERAIKIYVQDMTGLQEPQFNFELI